MMDDGDAGREDVGRIRREQKAGGFEKFKKGRTEFLSIGAVTPCVCGAILLARDACMGPQPIFLRR